jgi:hypothetical protein
MRQGALSFNLPLELVAAVADAIVEGVVQQLETKLQSRGSPWMTTEEAIRYSRLAEGTFRKLAASGSIPSHGGRSKIFHRVEVDHALGYLGDARPVLRKIGRA